MPLSTLDVTKPYDTFAQYLENWEKRLHEDALQPEPIIEELKETKRRLVDKHEKDFEQRITDRDTNYGARIEEWRTHCDERLKDWRNRFEPTEKENDDLRSRLEGELVAHRKALLDAQQVYYEERLSAQDHFHNEMKGELNRQIDELKTREQALQVRVNALLDERREWLDKRETDFNSDNRRERAFVNTLRKRVIQNEHPIQDAELEVSTWQILMRKHGWLGIGLVTFILAAMVIGCCYFHWGWYPSSRSSKGDADAVSSTMTLNEEVSITLKNGESKNEHER